MKKFLPFAFGLSLLFACSLPEPKAIDYVVFSGSVNNTEEDSLLLIGKDVRMGLMLDSAGNFSDTLRIPEGYYRLYGQRERTNIYLQHGKDLQLNFDMKEFDESLVYSGAGAEENNYLAAAYLINENMMGNTRELYSKNEAAFLEIITAYRDSLEKRLALATVNNQFQTDQSNDIKYEFTTAIEQYKPYHGYYAKIEDYDLSDTLNRERIAYDKNNAAEYERSTYYRDLIKTTFDGEVSELMDSNTTYMEAIKKATESWEAGAVKNGLLNSFAQYRMKPNEDLEAVYQFFVNAVTDSSMQAAYTEQYEKVKELLKGNPSPTFTDYENHAGGKMSLADLKGKFVYIDVWATWCGPCLREIPSLQEVEKQYHDKNITFVSISVDVDKDYETWVNMVKEKELGGIQLLSDKNWKSDFVQAYNINGIPRFILIDPAGNIVSADAPRPSNPELIELFNELAI